MIRTLYGLDQLGTPTAFLLSLVLGIAFGVILERAGFGSSRRLAGVFYFRDMAVPKVMATAVVTAMLGLSYAFGLGWIEVDQVYLMPSIYGAQVVGGLIFGVGFVLSGWCPGTAAVGTASGKLDALVFLGGVAAGSILFNEVFGLIEPLYRWGDRGTSTLYSVLGMSRPVFALLFTLAVVASFWACERVGKGGTDAGPPPRTRSLRAFSIALIAAAAGLFILPSPEAPGGSAPLQVAAGEDALLQDIEAARDHVATQELADRMIAGEEGLLVVDTRSPAEYGGFHLRGAVNVPITELAAYLEPRRNQGTVVLCSNGMVHPAQARDSLTRRGHTNVFILTDGLTAFQEEESMKPASLRLESVPDDARARIDTWRAYFAHPDAPPAQPAVGLGTSALPGLISVESLKTGLGARGVKVIDMRDQKDYNGGHIPGALALSPESVRGNLGGLPSVLMPADVLALRLSLMGIEPSDTVVLVYGGDKLRDATLVGMAFERLGHRAFGVLDGGHDAWLAQGGPKDTLLPSVARSHYPARSDADRFTVDYRTVFAEMKRGTVILDVRPADYFTGAKRDEARGGHIPGAVNRDFSLDLAPAGSGAPLKPVDDLSAAYAALIPAKDTPVIVHCRTGHQASQTYFVLTHVLGYTDVRWYDAGWTEWAARPELPVSTE